MVGFVSSMVAMELQWSISMETRFRYLEIGGIAIFSGDNADIRIRDQSDYS